MRSTALRVSNLRLIAIGTVVTDIPLFCCCRGDRYVSILISFRSAYLVVLRDVLLDSPESLSSGNARCELV